MSIWYAIIPVAVLDALLLTILIVVIWRFWDFVECFMRKRRERDLWRRE
jgi:hypothetical protein